MPCTLSAILPTFETGCTAQEIPENDTEKLHFYRPIRLYQRKRQKGARNATHEQKAAVAKQLNISQQQMTYVTHSEAGEGLIFYGNVILPFIDRFPQDTELYRVMTTKPGEVSA